ncbi:hypothetical protein TL16_g09805 [Triparma laevis f. inornata]|uniref:Uncharacterized protein n=1 Tax=Triparma laevis f. inornata TaxID=1714386 RepID=A0A9W7ENC1_9STRA|nr:hypothetical protein TL16_g09805 [Triparma laevis f. inornata]
MSNLTHASTQQIVTLKQNSGTAIQIGISDLSGMKDSNYTRESTASTDNQRMEWVNAELKKQTKNPSKKYTTRIIFLTMSLLNVFETLFWLLHVLNPNYFPNYNMYDNNSQVPQIFAALSAQSVFTHFMIHVERMYSSQNPEGSEWRPMKPEPCFAYHPFQNLTTNHPTTLLLKFHFVLHNLPNIFIILASFHRNKWTNAIESIMQLVLAPVIYRFLTLIFTTIRLKHTDLELGRMAEKSFGAGLGTFFICIFLGFETVGCFAFQDADDDQDSNELNPECLSSLYGNWMLSYNAVFTNVSYVVLYWLVEHDFSLLYLLRLKLGKQYTTSFGLQLIASFVFIFFFSQKEHPTKSIELAWPYASASFFLLWGASFVILCYQNVVNHEAAGFSSKSRMFSKQKSLVLADPLDRQENPQFDLGVKANSELNRNHGDLAKDKSYNKSDTDISLGSTTAGDMSAHVTPKKDLTALSSVRPDSPSTPHPEHEKPKSKNDIFNVLPSLLTTHRFTAKLHKLITSRHLFTLRFFLVGQTFAVAVVFLKMAMNYQESWRYIFEMVKTLSFCSMVVHYSLMIEHKPIYDHNAWFESKPVWVDGQFRFDRCLQVLVSAKLQFYVHNTCAFGWPVVGWLLDKDGQTVVSAASGVVKFCIVCFVLYNVIRRMCASLRDQVESENMQKLKMRKETLFVTGFGVMGISYFLTFEVIGCVAKSYFEWKDLDDGAVSMDEHLEKSCEIYKVANSCTAIHLTFMQIMYYLCFSMLTSTQIFTFNIKRIQLFAMMLTIFPTYAAAFLFSRREQIEDQLLDDIGIDQPLFWVAIVIGKSWFSVFWVIILSLLGYHARPVHLYKFYTNDQKEKEEDMNREQRVVSYDADGRPLSEAKVKEIEKRLDQDENPPNDANNLYYSSDEDNDNRSDSEDEEKEKDLEREPSRGKKNWRKLFHKEQETIRSAGAFKFMGLNRKTMRVRHERLYILRYITLLGTIIFTGLQMWHVTEMHKTDNSQSKGFAYIAQPLSFACWLMHYFSLFDKKETKFEYIHLSLHVFSHAILPIVITGSQKLWWNFLAYFFIFFLWLYFAFYCRKLKKKMNEQHQDKVHHFRQLNEIEKTLENFFAECISAFLVIFYVFLEASGCVEDSDIDECQPYFSSARIFSTTMSVPLVFYVCTFVADLSTYDVMCGYINRTLKVGLGLVSFTALVAIFSFGVRTWSFDVNNVQFFYTETFVDYWEIALFVSLITVIRGVLHDFEDQTQLKKELLHRQKAKNMRRTSIEAGHRLKFQQYDKATQKRALRKRQLLFSDAHGDDDAFDAVEVIKQRGASVEKSWELNEKDAVADHNNAHAHYREGRGTRITSNWIGLII